MGHFSQAITPGCSPTPQWLRAGRARCPAPAHLLPPLLPSGRPPDRGESLPWAFPVPGDTGGTGPGLGGIRVSRGTVLDVALGDKACQVTGWIQSQRVFPVFVLFEHSPLPHPLPCSAGPQGRSPTSPFSSSVPWSPAPAPSAALCPCWAVSGSSRSSPSSEPAPGPPLPPLPLPQPPLPPSSPSRTPTPAQGSGSAAPAPIKGGFSLPLVFFPHPNRRFLGANLGSPVGLEGLWGLQSCFLRSVL